MRKRKKVITKRLIKHNATINFTVGFFLLIFLIMFVSSGVVLVYYSVNNDQLYLILIGICMIFAPILTIMQTIGENNSFRHGEYVIVEDTLKEYEKKIETLLNDEDQIVYYLVFKDIYDLYLDKIVTDVSNYRKAKVDDKYYIVLNTYQSMIFNKNEYKLANNLHVTDIEDLPRYLDFKKIEKANGDKKEIDKFELKKKISDSFFAVKVNFTILVILLISNIMVLFGSSDNIEMHVIVPALSFIVIIASVIDLERFFNKLSAIRYGDILIKEDDVKEIDERTLIGHQTSKKALKLKFNKYKEDYVVLKDNYKGLKEGEKIYLVFFQDDDKPFAMYRKKDSFLSSELLNK